MEGEPPMIATMYRLSRNDCKELKLKDAYSIHKAVYSLFPKEADATRDFLFVDKGGCRDERNVLIISKRSPQQPEFGTIQSKNIPEAFFNHDYFGFEVKVNPVIRCGKTKKHVPVKGREELLNWFTGKSAEYGFLIEDRSLQINHTGVLQFDKDGSQCTYNTATFIGKLLVQNRERFKSSFESGIGRGKAFGFGLLQIIPLDRTNNSL
jgi:CRISPR system Cascade subunit CasE